MVGASIATLRFCIPPETLSLYVHLSKQYQEFPIDKHLGQRDWLDLK